MEKRKTLMLNNMDRVKSVDSAIDFFKEFGPKFDSSIEMDISTKLDPKKYPISATVTLEYGIPVKKNIYVFAPSDKEKEILECFKKFEAKMPDILLKVGFKDLVDEIQRNNAVPADICIATTDALPLLKNISTILTGMQKKGSKKTLNKMPSKKNGTITDNPSKVVEDILSGKQVNIKLEKDGHIKLKIGHVSFEKNKIHENIHAVFQTLSSLRPEKYKSMRDMIDKTFIGSAMTPSFSFKYKNTGDSHTLL